MGNILLLRKFIVLTNHLPIHYETPLSTIHTVDIACKLHT